MLCYEYIIFHSLWFTWQFYLLKELVSYTQAKFQHSTTNGWWDITFWTRCLCVTLTEASDLEFFVGGAYDIRLWGDTLWHSINLLWHIPLRKPPPECQTIYSIVTGPCCGQLKYEWDNPKMWQTAFGAIGGKQNSRWIKADRDWTKCTMYPCQSHWKKYLSFLKLFDFGSVIVHLPEPAFRILEWTC